jgi:hypothetical protein
MARNEHAAELAAFTTLLLEALEDPQVQRAVREVIRSSPPDRRRTAPLSIADVGQARDLKTARRQGRARG